ncbi:hypothetical protein [Devosia sp. A369]
MTFILKTYAVTVEGFPAYNYEAATPGQARSSAWQSYRSYRDISFREFLRISSLKRVESIDGFGRPITVGGKPAHWVSFNGQYVRFVRPNESVILLSHPNDVAEVA